MNYFNLTRDQAISLVGIETIEKLEEEIHKPERRTVSDILVSYNIEDGVTYAEYVIEYKVFIIKSNDESAEIVAYYRVNNDIKNLDNFDWGEAHHYAIY